MFDPKSLKATELAAFIDHTFLKPDGGVEPITKLCEEAKEYGFAAVAVNPAEVAYCANLLKDSPSRVCTTAGFPLGQNTTATKLYEIQNCIDCGADEIDMVINQRALRKGELELVREEIFRLSEICCPQDVISKIILECCNLTDSEKVLVCEMAVQAEVDFVKTSTGYGAHGAKVEDIRLMKGVVGDKVKVKASGGIRTLDSAMEMIAAGASRVGTSNGVQIMLDVSFADMCS